MIELLYERRSLENPSTPLSDPDDWLYDAFGAGASSSGVRVSRETALTYAAVWRAVNLISRDAAKLSCIIYRRMGEGKERATTHPAYRLLRYKPNVEMNAFTFWQTMIAYVLLDGNAYAYVLRRGDAAPLELIPLSHQPTYPVREGGRLLYVTRVGTEWRTLLPENVLHIKGLGCDGLCGYSVIAKARDSLGLGLGAREYQSRYFRNNARPSSVIEVPTQMQIPAQQELLRQWNEMHQGIDNAHRTAILTHGAKLNSYSINASDSQLLESRQFEIREIANWFGVPPHKLGDSSRTAYNSLEMENQSYLDEALDPWLVAIEQECRDKLLTEREKDNDTHVIEFMRQALVRADIQSRGQFYNIALSSGFMSVDEVRSRENLNPLPDGIGQKFRAPLNMGVLGSEDDEAEDPALIPDAPQLLAIVESVIAGQLPADAAEIIIQTAFPAMPKKDVKKLIKSAKSFEPEPPPTGSAVGDDEPPEDEPLPEEPPDDGDEPTDERQSWVNVIRPLIEHDVAHVARRMRKHLLSHAGKADFLSSVSSAVIEYYDQFRQAAAKHDELRAKVGLPAGDVSEFISQALGSLEEDLRALFAKVPVEGLPATVESRLTDYELSLSQQIADQLVRKVRND